MKVTLRTIRDGDLDTIFEYMKDPVAVHMAAFTAKDPTNRDDFNVQMEKIAQSLDCELFAVLANGEVVGTVGNYEEDESTEVTFWIGRSWWGRGVASQALGLLLAGLTKRPVRARVASDNAGSRRVLEKAGFVVIAIERGFAQARSAEIDELVLLLN